MSKCPILEELPIDPMPLISNGNLYLKAHDLAWLLCGIFTLFATSFSILLIYRHLTYFRLPQHQIYIIRILLMVPIYSISSLLSAIFYGTGAIYFELIRDAYESILLCSFFSLLLAFLSSPIPTILDSTLETPVEARENLREVVNHATVKKWIFPFGRIKWRPGGKTRNEGAATLYFLRLCVLQYVVIRPLSTILALSSNVFGYYCLDSWSPKFTHIYCTIAITISVTVAMSALIQTWALLSDQLKPFNPMSKFLAVKLVIFFTFWQDILLSLLISFKFIKSTNYLYFTPEEICTIIAAILSTFEMLVFSIFHFKAFSYAPYKAIPTTTSKSTSTKSSNSELIKPMTKLQALRKVLNFSDVFVDLWKGINYLYRDDSEEIQWKRKQHFLELDLGTRPRATKVYESSGEGRKSESGARLIEPNEFYQVERRFDQQGVEDRSNSQLEYQGSQLAYQGDQHDEGYNQNRMRTRQMGKSKIKLATAALINPPSTTLHERYKTLDSTEMDSLVVPRAEDEIPPAHSLESPYGPARSVIRHSQVPLARSIRSDTVAGGFVFEDY